MSFWVGANTETPRLVSTDGRRNASAPLIKWMFTTPTPRAKMGRPSPPPASVREPRTLPREHPMTSRRPRFGPAPALIACAIASVELAAAPGAFAQTADLVVVNGKVFTADARSSLAEGFAVKGGRFIAVGSSAAMQEHVGPGSRVIDLHGRFVT